MQYGYSTVDLFIHDPRCGVPIVEDVAQEWTAMSAWRDEQPTGDEKSPDASMFTALRAARGTQSRSRVPCGDQLAN